MKKAWDGRFQRSLDDKAAHFSASVDIDKRLALEDLQGSEAHVTMLGQQGILSDAECQRIKQGLSDLRSAVEQERITWKPEHEDVHMNLEMALTDAIGEVGGKLHTARSRNDQVSTDMRMWTRSACSQTIELLDRTLEVLWRQASSHLDVLMPGYTHLQRAQPVRFAHHLLAWAEMLERDRSRLCDARSRLNECPLGSGALAGTTFDIDRHATAQMLGFREPTRNSLDAVSDRDFLIESVSSLSIIALHLSRMCEELVVWCSQEFAFVEMSDAFSTGSSMMPQKKNPDMAELIRGKTGRVIGHLVNLMVMLKSLPLSYNRDMQEDKQPVFDAFDTVCESLDIFASMVDSMEVKAAQMQAALSEGFTNATEIADYLANKGIPFRDAHHITGLIVAHALQHKQALEDIDLKTLQGFCQAIDKDIYHVLDMNVVVERRNVLGGPARAQVETQLRTLKQRLSERTASSQPSTQDP